MSASHCMDKILNDFQCHLPFVAQALVDHHGVILESSANWRDFGFENIFPGKQIDSVIDALWGIFPLEQSDEIQLPLVVSSNKKFLDFIIKPLNGGQVIFAVDVTPKALAMQELQQVRNELEFFKRDIYKVFPERLGLDINTGREDVVQQAKQLIYSSRLAALGEMASGLSHEINNPLMIIQGSLGIIEELLKQNLAFEGRMSEFVGRAKIAVGRIVYIIKGLKNFARQDQGAVKEVVLLSTILNDTFVFCSEMLKSHKIKFVIDEVPCININCHPLQISQVLFSLIKNADEVLVKAKDESQKWIRISFNESATHAFIHISNGGEQISLIDQTKIFQPFFTTKEIGEGMGLGLAISRGIMQEHEGELIFDPAAVNTTFIVKLPKVIQH